MSITFCFSVAMQLVNPVLIDESLRYFEHTGENTSLNTSDHENYEDFQMEEPTSFFSLLQLLYLSYMPVCCVVGFTGNCMVWILIR